MNRFWKMKVHDCIYPSGNKTETYLKVSNQSSITGKRLYHVVSSSRLPNNNFVIRMNRFYLLRSKYQNIPKTVHPLHLFASDLSHEPYVKWLAIVHQVYVVRKFFSFLLFIKIRPSGFLFV